MVSSNECECIWIECESKCEYESDVVIEVFDIAYDNRLERHAWPWLLTG